MSWMTFDEFEEQCFDCPHCGYPISREDIEPYAKTCTCDACGVEIDVPERENQNDSDETALGENEDTEGL